MYLAYSALDTNPINPLQLAGLQNDENNNEVMLRYQGYQTACDKLACEIAAIQKYIPGWLPKFR
jgi:hypothetical protein